MSTYYNRIESPIGTLTITADVKAITGLLMDTEANRQTPCTGWIHSPQHELIRLAERQLESYFAKQLKRFELPLAPEGTAFQKTVWGELTRIPYGETISYGELARRIGNSNASRAVGLANGRNPIAIIVPCHRVIGANGKLVGFGGGLDRKSYLLGLEQGALAL